MPKLMQITKKYGNKSIFDHFDLDLAENKLSVIMGASGVGKTTLLNILSGLTDFEGEVIVERPISYIFQSDRLIPELTVRKNLEFVLKNVSLSKEMSEIIAEMLDWVGLSDKENVYPNELSGGEKQRVSIARAFVYPSKTILLDEPFASLDYSLKVQLMNLLTDLLKKTNKTAVFITHNLDEALTVADDIYVLGKNSIVYKKSLPHQEGLRKITGEYVDLVREEILDVLSKV